MKKLAEKRPSTKNKGNTYNKYNHVSKFIESETIGNGSGSDLYSACSSNNEYEEDFINDRSEISESSCLKSLMINKEKIWKKAEKLDLKCLYFKKTNNLHLYFMNLNLKILRIAILLTIWKSKFLFSSNHCKNIQNTID